MPLAIASVACEPPLGSVTWVNGQSARFVVGVELVEHSQSDLQALIWHEDEDGWTELQLERHSQTSDLIVFAGSLVPRIGVKRTIRFTVKIGLNGDYHWVNDLDPDPQTDGTVVFQSKSDRPPTLTQYIAPHDCWQVEHLQGDQDGQVNAWEFVSGIDGDSEEVVRLGRLQDILRWFAIVRHSTPWLGPRQGGNHFEVDKPALLVAFLLADGTHLVICPEHGKPDITTSLEDDGAGNIVVRSRNDAETRATVRIILSAGNEFELTLADAVRNSRLGSPGPPASAKVDKEALEDWYDGFSYCTWNGLGRELDEEKIQQALSTLSQHGLVVPNLIIDDNWQSLDNIDNGDPFTYRWTDFEANKENFPRGLKHTITNIRASHTHLRHVAVWHGIFGYWGGFSPDGNIAKCYATQEVQKQNQESYMKGDTATVVSAKDAHTMYDDFYRFLAECGIDSVKADNGFYPDYIQGAQDRRELIYTYQDAFLQASETHFGHRAISCMSQTPQNLFYSFMDDGKRPRYLVRNSDDFFPDAPESHTWHIFCNAHNSVLTQHLNILPDWDMFQTAGPNPYMHAAARCLSGGPIYITDKPGEHDIRLIHQMTTLGLDGRHRILRPEIIGRATEVYNKPQSRRFLRIAAGHLDTCFLGLFNMSDRESVELVTLRAITRSESHGSYIVLKHYDKCRKVHHLSSIHDVVSVKLSPSGGHEILTAYPISTAGTFDFAILGLTGHMTGAAVLAQKPHAKSLANDAGAFLKMTIKAPGSLAIWVRDVTRGKVSASITVPHKGRYVARAVRVVDPGMTEDVIVLDVGAAWERAIADGIVDDADRQSMRRLVLTVEIQNQ